MPCRFIVIALISTADGDSNFLSSFSLDNSNCVGFLKKFEFCYTLLYMIMDRPAFLDTLLRIFTSEQERFFKTGIKVGIMYMYII